mmetsp:Transcript_131936/g.257099  ORF Transcript_131936/g.257099 Transcript_131936/m.257099 type:complete len:98 (+) Transcript_131936:2019-2312(+)
MQLRTPVYHEKHRIVIRECFDDALSWPQQQDKRQHALEGHADTESFAQGFERSALPRPHDALNVDENYGPAGQEYSSKQVERDDDCEPDALLLADQK